MAVGQNGLNWYINVFVWIIVADHTLIYLSLVSDTKRDRQMVCSGQWLRVTWRILRTIGIQLFQIDRTRCGGTIYVFVSDKYFCTFFFLLILLQMSSNGVSFHFQVVVKGILHNTFQFSCFEHKTRHKLNFLWQNDFMIFITELVR